MMAEAEAEAEAEAADDEAVAEDEAEAGEEAAAEEVDSVAKSASGSSVVADTADAAAPEEDLPRASEAATAICAVKNQTNKDIRTRQEFECDMLKTKANARHILEHDELQQKRKYQPKQKFEDASSPTQTHA
jgi:hypothetical protein